MHLIATCTVEDLNGFNNSRVRGLRYLEGIGMARIENMKISTTRMANTKV